ncbi:MAG TPA: hypothetical protein DCY03_32800 [Planctomycetaceae bacterium]|nr:hypothetical protein [Planctomycetaceae bacterium]|tara:strand:- start:52085 stop:52483 length:399 start_codon:yes stop_codon:yes gene_type:complete
MKWEYSKPVSTRTGLWLLVLTVVLPFILWLLIEARLPFLIAFLVIPVIFTAIWHDAGFVIGGIFFWGGLILWGESTVKPDQVDNILPGLTLTLGWGFYVFFYGPVFLLIKSNDRYREKWSGTCSADDSERLS